MKLAYNITLGIILALYSLGLSSCGWEAPPVAIEVGYESPNTGIDYKVKRNPDGSYVVIAQK